MSAIDNINILLNGSSTLSDAIAAEAALRKSYPAFVLPTELLLKNWGETMPAEARSEALGRVALFCTDRLALSRLENIRDNYAGFYPEEEGQATPSTNSAIDTFLKTYGGAGAGSDAETAMLEKLIFNPVPQDYAETLRSEDDSENEIPVDETISRIDSFISAHPTDSTERTPVTAQVEQAEKETPSTPAIVDSSSLLSESLAKIYIKQHRYDKAFEIISQLSLNYPEKSVYFADQLRFLRKLMIVQSHKKRRQR